MVRRRLYDDERVSYAAIIQSFLAEVCEEVDTGLAFSAISTDPRSIHRRGIAQSKSKTLDRCNRHGASNFTSQQNLETRKTPERKESSWLQMGIQD